MVGLGRGVRQSGLLDRVQSGLFRRQSPVAGIQSDEIWIGPECDPSRPLTAWERLRRSRRSSLHRGSRPSSSMGSGSSSANRCCRDCPRAASAAVAPNSPQPRYRSPASPVLSPSASSTVSSAPSPSRNLPTSSRLVMFRPRNWPHCRDWQAANGRSPSTLARAVHSSGRERPGQHHRGRVVAPRRSTGDRRRGGRRGPRHHRSGFAPDCSGRRARRSPRAAGCHTAPQAGPRGHGRRTRLEQPLRGPNCSDLGLVERRCDSGGRGRSPSSMDLATGTGARPGGASVSRRLATAWRAPGSGGRAGRREAGKPLGVRIAELVGDAVLRRRPGARAADGALPAADGDRRSAGRAGRRQRPRTRATTFYLGLLMNTHCHADAAEQATWFGDDIGFKGEGVETLGMNTAQSIAFFVRRLGVARQRRRSGRGGSRRSRSRAAAGARVHDDARGAGRPVRRADRPGPGGLRRHRPGVRAVGRQGRARPAARGARSGCRRGWCSWPARSRCSAAATASQAAVAMARRQRGHPVRPGAGRPVLRPRRARCSTAWTRPRAGTPCSTPSRSRRRRVAGAELDDVLEAMADLVDLKSPYLAGHSRGVANLAARRRGVSGLPATTRTTRAPGRR